MYSFLLALIYIAFISLGLPDSLLGSAWPTLHSDLGVPISYMGIVSMIISCGTIISSLISDRVTRKLGTSRVTVISVFLTAAALFGFSISNKFWMLIIFAVPYGLGAGAIDAALNNYVALHYKSKHMSWLHSFWGVGTVISPFVMSYALTTSTWNNGYKIISLIQIGIGLLLFFTLPVWRINKEKSNTPSAAKSVGLFGALKIKGVTFLLLGFFTYCSAEATAMGWASTYLVTVKNINEKTAAAFGSLVFIGITIGRFLAGFFADKLGDRKMILLGCSFAIFGIILLLVPIKANILSLLGFVVIGFGFAPVYPSIIHSTPYNFGAEHSGAIIGIQMASAYLGATFMPPLYGLLGRYIGFKIMPIYLILFLTITMLMTERTFKLASKK